MLDEELEYTSEYLKEQAKTKIILIKNILIFSVSPNSHSSIDNNIKINLKDQEKIDNFIKKVRTSY